MLDLSHNQISRLDQLQTNSDPVDQQPNDQLNGSLTDEEEELTENLIQRSCQWPQLRRLIFKYNNMERIDESLVRVVHVIYVL